MSHAIKAILFDLDDTLFDHHHSVQAGLVALQDVYPGLQQWPLGHLTNTYVELVESLHLLVLQGLLTPDQARIQRMQAFFQGYGCVLPLDEIQRAASLYRQTYQAARQTVPGAISLLQRLRVNTKIGIITNNTSLEQREKLDVCGLTPLVDVIVISEEVGVIKPDPAIFTIALERLGCSAGETIMVGDSWTTDITGARQAGIQSVWLNRFGRSCPDSTFARVIDAFEPAEIVAGLLLNP